MLACWRLQQPLLTRYVGRAFFVHICPCTRAVISVGQIPTTGVPGSKDLCILKWFWSTLDIIWWTSRHQIWFVLWRWYQTLSAILLPGLWIQAPHSTYSIPGPFIIRKFLLPMSLHCCPPTPPTPAFDIQYHSRNLLLLDILTFLNCNHCQEGLVHWMF